MKNIIIVMIIISLNIGKLIIIGAIDNILLGGIMMILQIIIEISKAQ